jgi:uncharacterized protein with NRDE domain
MGECLIVTAHKSPPRFSLVMTRNDDRLLDAVSTQKLEWVTPKISLMGAGDTEGTGKLSLAAEGAGTPSIFFTGPS